MNTTSSSSTPIGSSVIGHGPAKPRKSNGGPKHTPRSGVYLGRDVRSIRRAQNTMCYVANGPLTPDQRGAIRSLSNVQSRDGGLR